MNGKSQRMRVDLLATKLVYFTIYGYIGSILPYLNVFYVSIGLSVRQSGLISGLRTIPSIFTGPLIGFLADVTQKHRTVFLSLLLVLTASTFPLPWIAKSMSSGERVNNTVVNKEQLFLSSDENISLFYVMLFLASVTGITGIPLIGFADAVVMRVVSNHRKHTSIGKQRVAGSIGFAMVSFISGLAADNYQPYGMSKYTGAFIVMLLTEVFLALSVLLLHSRDSASNKEVENDEEAFNNNAFNNKDGNGIDNKRQLYLLVLQKFGDKRYLFLFFIATHMGLNNAIINGFLPMVMEDLSSSKTCIGITIAVAAIFEIIIYPFSFKLIKFLRGVYPSIIVAVLSYAGRFLCMAVLKNRWLFIPVQMFQALGVALFWAAVTEYVNDITPVDISSTVFSMLSTLYYSLGNVLGNVVAGLLYQKFGGPILFIGCCVHSTVVALFFTLVFVILYKRNKRFFEYQQFDERICHL